MPSQGDHQCIEFSMQEQSHPVNTVRGGKGRCPYWNTRQHRKDKLREYLEEARLIDGLGWVKSAGSLEFSVWVKDGKWSQHVITRCLVGSCPNKILVLSTNSFFGTAEKICRLYRVGHLTFSI